jgi:allophanate hydrolase
MTISELLNDYKNGTTTPRDVMSAIKKRIDEHADNPVFIRVLDDAQLEPYLTRLEASDASELPLYGIPFAIKDNIDLAGVPTTAACAEFSYTPNHSAFVVEQLIAAGAIPVGKANLDQFATGLVGTRSPYGACRNSIDPEYLSGGSSSGSAVSVALDMAVFSLGTDTAGSGRVPAAFNNLVGLKPSKGVLSTSGVVPACRSLDCVSIFAKTPKMRVRYLMSPAPSMPPTPIAERCRES